LLHRKPCIMSATAQHPWIQSLHAGLDGLESALLDGDAMAVEAASAQVQRVLQRAPVTTEFLQPGSDLPDALPQAAQRFGQLRQAVVRASAQSQRAVQSLMPPGSSSGSTYSATGKGQVGPRGRTYLSA